MENPYLLLWLEGPLQSWGHDSKFNRRDTQKFPTKSGILGLVCCALGKSGEQTDLLSAFSRLDMQIVAYKSNTVEGFLPMRETRLCDFHMVGSGYDDKDPWERRMIPKTGDGKKAVGGGTKLTYRYYLQDMTFAVALQIPQSLRETLIHHLKYPVWDLYLGRKNCVSTDFIYRDEFLTAEACFQHAEKMAEEKNRLSDFMVLDGKKEGGEVYTVNDVPVQFGTRKIYRDRTITVKKPKEVYAGG